MNQFVIVTVSLLNLIITVSYIWLLVKKRIKPALAMWTFFTLAVGMSLMTYMEAGNYSFWDNILNTTDLGLAVSVMIAIYFFGDKTMRFSRFDQLCLFAVLSIIAFWYFTKNHFVANLSIQMIMITAYFPVIKRMLKSNENTEPFFVWILMMVAPLISLLANKGILASIYAIRASICTALLLMLMVRIEVRNRKSVATKKVTNIGKVY